jgi:hypothetical protein
MSKFLGHLIKHRARRYAKAVLDPLLGVFRPANVAMFHVGRVGSTVLAGMLQQHRRISWSGELFEKEHSRYMKAVASGSYELPKDPLKILRTEMRAARNRVFGFETKFLDEHHIKVIGLDLEAYVAKLSDLGFGGFIVLKRKNILRRLISGVVLRDRDVHHIRASKEWPERLDRLLAGKQVCQLNYEEHISDSPAVAYRKVVAFMGLKPGEPEILLRKTNPGPLQEMIENYDELRAALDGTPYRWMLDRA